MKHLQFALNTTRWRGSYLASHMSQWHSVVAIWRPMSQWHSVVAIWLPMCHNDTQWMLSGFPYVTMTLSGCYMASHVTMTLSGCYMASHMSQWHSVDAIWRPMSQWHSVDAIWIPICHIDTQWLLTGFPFVTIILSGCYLASHVTMTLSGCYMASYVSQWHSVN